MPSDGLVATAGEGSAPQDRPSPLTNEALTEVLEYFFRNLVRLLYSNHFKQRCASRGIDQSEVLRVLTLGRIVGNPQWQDKGNDWTYGVRGNDVEGDEVEFRIAVSKERDCITLVTVIDPN